MGDVSGGTDWQTERGDNHLFVVPISERTGQLAGYRWGIADNKGSIVMLVK